jgi:hypothetical protein
MAVSFADLKASTMNTMTRGADIKDRVAAFRERMGASKNESTKVGRGTEVAQGTKEAPRINSAAQNFGSREAAQRGSVPSRGGFMMNDETRAEAEKKMNEASNMEDRLFWVSQITGDSKHYDRWMKREAGLAPRRERAEANMPQWARNKYGSGASGSEATTSSNSLA